MDVFVTLLCVMLILHTGVIHARHIEEDERLEDSASVVMEDVGIVELSPRDFGTADVTVRFNGVETDLTALIDHIRSAGAEQVILDAEPTTPHAGWQRTLRLLQDAGIETWERTLSP